MDDVIHFRWVIFPLKLIVIMLTYNVNWRLYLEFEINNREYGPLSDKDALN